MNESKSLINAVIMDKDEWQPSKEPELLGIRDLISLAEANIIKMTGVPKSFVNP